MLMKAGIYKIVSPSGRVYIGQSKDIDSRLTRYKKVQCCKSQLLLYRSFVKYGVDSHIFEVIVRGDYSKQELNNLETKYITEHDSFKNGLNLTSGGDSYEFHPDVRLKMSNTRRRKIAEGQLNSKLSINDVIEIKKLLSNKIKQKDIAARFNVSANLITEIKKGRAWSNIKID